MRVDILLLMIVCGALTFLLRFSFIAGARFLPQSPALRHLLRYVPPTVLAALIAPEILMQNDALSLEPGNIRLWAALVALAAAYWTRHVLATIAAGMVALWLLQALVG
ncbi:MAG: AzlD domain-containing protein [Burkholderiales bacterium]|jgi:branched-subunit amino acid transport protein|nr:AzlD domain-containing protein [Burkholderiales bacterium]